MHGTKVRFMRDILSEVKSHLKQNEVNHMEVPHYQEISVKNLYKDTMKDECWPSTSLLSSNCLCYCLNEISSLVCCARCGTST